MKRLFRSSLALILVLPLLTACDNPEEGKSTPAEVTGAADQAVASPEMKSQQKATDAKQPMELDWNALVPEDWRPDKLMEKYNIADLSDDDPRADELAEKLKTFWQEAPLVEDLDGKYVKLPGFVVPLETDVETIQEFLLVPYFGACIHTPPPPANQTVYVVTDAGKPYRGKLFDIVWVSGTMKIEKFSSDLGDAGYRIEALSVEPYEQ